MLAWQAQFYLLLGHWDKAVEAANEVLRLSTISPSLFMNLPLNNSIPRWRVNLLFGAGAPAMR
jgi:hypothetical protein